MTGLLYYLRFQRNESGFPPDVVERSSRRQSIFVQSLRGAIQHLESIIQGVARLIWVRNHVVDVRRQLNEMWRNSSGQQMMIRRFRL